MGQRGVHATINKDETTGRFVVHLTTVQWSLHIAEIIKFALQHAGKDGYSQTEIYLYETIAPLRFYPNRDPRFDRYKISI